MNLKFVVIFSVLSLTSCSCGLLNWFDELSDKLDPNNAETNSREKRKAEENGIKPDITKPTADKTVSLMDIKEGKLTAQSEPTGTRRGNLKTKSYMVSAYNPIVGGARRSSKLLPLVNRDSTPKERCEACTNRPTCKLLKQCDQCNEDCKGIAVNTDDLISPGTNQLVGMSYRMTSPNRNDLSSKTHYPISTYRDGETKDILCRIVGIADTSDIESVTIWVTTHSNTPPKSINTVTDDMPGTPKKFKENLRESQPTLTKMSMTNGQVPSPDIQARFNDYDDDNDKVFSRLTNNGMEKIKANPDVIEGPPPFVGSNNLPPSEPSPTNKDNNLGASGISIDKIGTFNKPIIVQPKEFVSDESEEDDADDDAYPSSPVPSLPPNKESTTTKDVTKPPLLNKLRELASSRASRISDLKDRRQKIDNSPPVKEGFIGNLLKSRQNNVEEKTKTQNPFILQDVADNIARASTNENQNPSIKLPGESDDQIAKINEAIQEVKSMVKNIQEEASKASEKRLLGVSHTADTSSDLPQSTIAPLSIPPLQTNQMPQLLPNHVADNFKKVNKYLIDRAQDALDIIGPKHETNQLLKPKEVGNGEDEHSEITKNTITNFKKMPQYLLDRFKEGLNGFENKRVGNTAVDVNTNNIGEGDVKENNMKLTERFGDDENKMHRGENVADINNEVGSNETASNDDDDTVVGQPEQNILENKVRPNIETISNADTPTTKTYKNKFEKYMTEIKEKRQKAYSPEKFLPNSSPMASRMASLPIKVEESVGSTGPIKDVIPNKEEMESNYGKDKAAQSKILVPSNDLENQRDILRNKLKKFIEGIKSKATSTPVPIKIAEITPSTVPEKPGLVSLDKQDPNSFIKPIVEPQTLSDSSLPAFEELSASKGVPPQSFSQPIDQLVGESKPSDKQGVFHFLPTIPTLSGNEINQSTEPSNKLQKYLENLKAKQSKLFEPKSDNSKVFIPVPKPSNEPEDKKNLLNTKIKSYVDSLKKPVDATVGQPEMSLNQRMSDQISKLNNKVESDMKDYLGSTPDIFKKDLLKEKLRNYISSLRKPMGSKLVPEFVRKTSEAQQEELNSLKKKLESLLKAKEPTSSVNLGENTLISKAEPNPSISEIPSVNTNIFPIVGRTKAIVVPNNNIVGDIQHPVLDNHLEPENDETSINRQTVDNPGLNLPEGVDNLDWSHSLGKIVQSSTKPKDIFFLGGGIKLPLKLTEGPNGMDLSVDLEKLCSCYNSTSCSKNHTAIEETVGEILEKEAELNEQLKDVSLDDVKKEPVLGSPRMEQPMVEEAGSINRKPTIMQKFLSNLNSKTVQNKKSNIFKRSSDVRGLSPELTTIKNVLEKLKKENEESIKNSVIKDSDLPILPSLDVVADELTNLEQKVQNSVTNSVKEITNNVEEIKEELEGKIVGANLYPNLFFNPNIPKIPIYNPDWVQNSFNEIKEQAEEINKNMLDKLEHTNNLNNLLQVNGLRTSSGVDLLNNDYIKSLTPKNMINGMLKSNGLNTMELPLENPMDAVKNQINDVIRKFEEQKTANKITQRTGLNKIQLPKISTYFTTRDPLSSINNFQEKLKESLPGIPDLQNRVNEINDDVVKITDTYQFGQTNILEKKLKQLDNEIQKYYDKNEKLLSGESKKLLGGHKGEIVDKEVNIINRIISWIRSLASGIKI